MARYIDVDKFLGELDRQICSDCIDEDAHCCSCGVGCARGIAKDLAADVAPKSEVERLTINMNAYGLTAKRLKEDVDRLQDINNRDVENLRLAKAEVAREIFEEIENVACIYKLDGDFYIDNSFYAELKKKYTEVE